jgi:hypothetical protein
MGLFKRFFGNRYNWIKKEDPRLPYTYQASLQVFEGDNDIVINWFSDTICGICGYLKKHKEDPNDITITECFDGKETVIPPDVYMNDGEWLPKKELCKAHRRYGSEGNEECCSFQHRDQKVSKI